MNGQSGGGTVRDVVNALYQLNAFAHDETLPEEGRKLAAIDRDALFAQTALGWYASDNRDLGRLAAALELGMSFSDRAASPDEETRRLIEERLGGPITDSSTDPYGPGGRVRGGTGLTDFTGSSLTQGELHKLGISQAGGAPMLDGDRRPRTAPPEKPGRIERAFDFITSPLRPAQYHGADDDNDFALLLDKLGDLPSGMYDAEAISIGQVLTNPVENGVVQTEKGPVDLMPLKLGEAFTVVAPDGTEAHISVDQGLLNELESVQAGGYLGQNVGGTLVRSLYHTGRSNDPMAWKVDTPYGEMLMPNITGNPLLDRQLMADPVWLRSMREADKASGWNRFLRGTTNVVTMVGEIGVTNRLGAAALGGAGRAATKRFPTLGAWADAAAEGAIASKARGITAGLNTRIPGLAFDLRQIPEMAWYESVNWAAGLPLGRDEEFSERVGQGIVMGVEGAFAGYGLRAAKAIGRMGLTSESFDKFTRLISRGKWEGLPERARQYLGRFDTPPDAMAMEKAWTRANEIRSMSMDAIKTYVREELEDAQSKFLRSRLIDQAVDGAIIMSWFGAHGGAMQLAADEGKDWESMDAWEQAAYWFEAYKTPAPYAAAMGALLGHAGSFKRSMSKKDRASFFDEDATKAINDVAELTAHAIKRFGDPNESMTAMGAMTGVNVWRMQATPQQLEALMMLGGGARRETDVARLEAARLHEARTRLVLEAIGKEGGPETVRTMLMAMRKGELTDLASRVRNIGVEEAELRLPGKELDTMIRSEFVRRRKGGKEAAEQPVEPHPTESLPADIDPTAPLIQVAGKPYHVKDGRLYPAKDSAQPASKAQPPKKPEPPRKLIPPEEWSKEFTPETHYLGVPGATQGTVVYRLGKTRWSVIEGTGPGGRAAYFVMEGRRASDMKVARGTGFYEYSEGGLQHAMGVALAKSKVAAFNDVEMYWLGLRKAPPRIVEELDPNRVAELPPGSQKLLDALREAADRAEVKLRESEERRLERKQRSEEIYQGYVDKYRDLRKKRGDGFMRWLGGRILSDRKRKAWEEVMGGKAPEPKGDQAVGRELAEPEQVKATAELVADALENAPGQAGKDPGQLVFDFMGEGPYSKQELAEVAVEAEAQRMRAPEMKDPEAKPAEPQPPVSSQLWSDPGDVAAFQAGAHFTALRSNKALKEAVAMAVEAEALGAAAARTQDLGAVLQARQRLEALATGMLAAAPALSKHSKARLELIQAVTGLEMAQIHRLHERMVAEGATRDAHIDAVLAGFTDATGRRLISERQAKRTDTRDMLRIAAVAPVEAASPGKPRIPGKQALVALKKQWEDGGYVPVVEMLMRSGAASNEADARLKADALFMGPDGNGGKLQAIGKALVKAERARAPDLAMLLQERIAYRNFKGRRVGGDAPVPNTGKTLRDLAVSLLSKLSGNDVRVERHVKAADEVPTAESFLREPVAQEQAATPPVATERANGEDVGASYKRALSNQEKALEILGTLPSFEQVREILAERGADFEDPVGLFAFERRVMRQLIEGDQRLLDEFLAVHGEAREGGQGEELFKQARAAATDSVGFAQDHYKSAAMRLEGEREGGNPTLVGQQIDTMWDALKAHAADAPLTETQVAILNQATTVLPNGAAWRDPNGNYWLHPRAQRDFSRLMVDVLAQAEGPVNMYGGPHLSKEEAARFARNVVAFAGGYFGDVYQGNKEWAQRSRLSLSSLVPKATRDKMGMRAVMDSLYRDDPKWQSGGMRKLGKALIKQLAPVWQWYVARGQSSGFFPSEIAAKNLANRRTRLENEAKAGDFIQQAKDLIDRMGDMGLTSYDAAFVGKLIEAGALDRIRTQKEFENIWGEGSGYLFGVTRDVATLFAEMGEELFKVGAIDLKAFETLRGRYLPKVILNIDQGPEAQLQRQRRSETKGWTVDSSRFPRNNTELVEGMHRIYDVRYLLPVGVARQTKLIQLWRGISALAKNGTLISREEYEAMPDGAKIHWRKAAERVGGDRAGEFSPAELQAMGPGEREAVTKRRRASKVEQWMLQELIEGERKAEADGNLELTGTMRDLLDRLETGYLPTNVLQEVGLLISSSDVAASQFNSKWGDTVNEMTRIWRELRTFQSPKFWVLNNTSSVVTNHGTDRLNMLDMLDPDGYYQRSRRMLTEFLRWEEAGRDPAAVNRNIALVQQFMRLMGRNNLMSQIQGPQRMADVMESMFTPSNFDTLIPRGPGHETRLSDQFMREMLLSEFRAGRTHAEISKDMYKLWGSANPEERFQANLMLSSMQQTHEAWFKMAPWLRAIERGMDMTEAAEWAAKGTGDYNDRNPFIYRLSTSFTTSVSQIEGKAWARGRKGGDEGLPTSQKMLRSMVGSPFWMYRMSMYPELARSVWTNTTKMMVAHGILGGLFAAISTAFGGDENLIADGLSGHEEFANAKLSDNDIDKLAAKYRDYQVPGIVGLFGVTMGEKLQFWKAWRKRVLHNVSFGLLGENDDRANMIGVARGPSFGGKTSYFDLSEFYRVPLTMSQGFSRLGSAMSGANDYKQFSTATAMDELGFGFLPSMVGAAVTRAYGLAKGRQGESRWETATAMTLDGLAEVSAPMGGGFLTSSHGQRFARNTIWDGRSLHEIIDGLPGSGYGGTPLGGAVHAVAGMMLPLRQLPVGRSGSGEATLLSALGLDDPYLRRGVDEEGASGQIRQRSVRDAIQGLYSQAYKEHLDTGVPLAHIHQRMFDLSDDLILDGSGRAVGIKENPLSDLGKYVASRGGEEAQSAYLDSVIRSLRLHRNDIAQHLTGAGGLSYRTDVAPEVHDRIVRAVWNKQGGDAQMLNFLYDAVFKGSNRGWAAPYDGLWYRMYFNEGLNRYTPQTEGSASAIKMERLRKWVSERRAGSTPDMDPRSYTEQVIEGMRGRAIDMAPATYIQSLPSVDVLTGSR